MSEPVSTTLQLEVTRTSEPERNQEGNQKGNQEGSQEGNQQSLQESLQEDLQGSLEEPLPGTFQALFPRIFPGTSPGTFPRVLRESDGDGVETVVIASLSPFKTNAVCQAFAHTFPSKRFAYKNFTVTTDVRLQPVSDEETFRGARNRAYNAQVVFPAAQYWIGIELGVEEHFGAMQSFAWVTILSYGGVEHGWRMTKARTATFYQPEEVAKLVRSGMSLMHANDVVFSNDNKRLHIGSVGVMTGGLVDKAEFFKQAVVLALMPLADRNANLTFDTGYNYIQH